MKKKISMLIVGLLIFSVETVWGYTEVEDFTFFGSHAGENTTGYYNSFFGNHAGQENTIGMFNSTFGFGAGWQNTTGNENSFFGYKAGGYNTTGSLNNFFGYSAGENSTGSYNNFFGALAGYSNKGYYNNFFGHKAGYNNTEGVYNNFFGYEAGYSNTTGNYNNFWGYDAGYSNIDGYYNTFLGMWAGRSNTSGFANDFLGTQAGFNNTTGNNNLFIGHHAGHSNTEGSYNVFIGSEAGYDETGSNKLIISNSYTDSPLIYGEFDNKYLEVNGDLGISGANRIGIGTSNPEHSIHVIQHRANMELSGYAAPPPSGNTALSFLRLKNRYDGDNFGFYLRKNSAGQSEVILSGYDASAGKYLTFAFFNVDTTTYEIRNGVGDVLFRNSGNIGIGTTTPSHRLEFARGAYSDGATWVNASSRELKENIKEVSAEEAIKTVENLKPVAFNYKEGNEELHMGFIAEDVPELVATSDRKGLESMDIVAVLTKVVQEQQKTMQEQQKSIQELLRRDQEQQAMIGKLQTALQFKQDKNADLAQVD